VLDALPEVTRREVQRRSRAIMAKGGLGREEILADPSRRLPHDTGLELLRMATQVLGDPALCLRAPLLAQPGDYELFEYLAQHAPTVGDGLEQVRRYLRLVLDADCDLIPLGDRMLLRVAVAPGLEDPPQVYELLLGAIFVTLLRSPALDGRELGPYAVYFKHPAPDYAAEYHHVFRVDPHFGAPHNGFAFAPEILALRKPWTDPVLFGMLGRLADATLASLPRSRSVRHRVHDALREGLEQGCGDLAAVAKTVGLSPATLRRRLAEEGTTFSLVLEQLRREQSRDLLQRHELSIAEVAYRLGFAHAPAFHRAFKRWFGQAPSEFRSALQRHPAYRLLIPGGGGPS
jgi:AraC-like DNA-binding protein